MKKIMDFSFRKKLFIFVLQFSALLVTLVTFVASTVAYKTMREQLIYDRRMNIRWLQERLKTEVDSYLNRFYEFEVNKQLKTNIATWCNEDQEIDYALKLDLITTLNETISMDKNINSIEIYNFSKNQVLVAKRSGADMEEIGDKLDSWNQRSKSLQTNIVFSRSEKEILVSHKIINFNNKKPMVLITMNIRPYEIEDILEDNKTTKDESILIFNDQNELIEADFGFGTQFKENFLVDVVNKLEKAQSQELFQDGRFWFLREVGNGKLKILMIVPNSSLVSVLNSTILAGIAIGMVAVVLSTIVSVLFSRTFSKPIIDLATKMRTITINDYSDIVVQDRKDEIGFLNHSFSIMLERNKKLITQEYQSKIEKREAQLRALQAQINPHFMFNTLQVIGGMALDQGAPQVYKVTTALGDIMRYSLNFSDEMVCLKEELQYFQSYLTIQNERFGNRINLEIRIVEDLLDYLIPKLILQPLLENSMEHGLSHKSGEWRIQLGGNLTRNGDLKLTLTDNGVGITPDHLEAIQAHLKNETGQSLKTNVHIGLCNVNARIRLKFMEDKYGITIESTYGEGTTVQLLTKGIRRDFNGKL